VLAIREWDIRLAIEDRLSKIETKVYSEWTIGVTAHPDQRKEEERNPRRWGCWEADSEVIARNVEKYFLDKGMKGETGGGEESRHVYIFQSSNVS
jgi:hypothetical protein